MMNLRILLLSILFVFFIIFSTESVAQMPVITENHKLTYEKSYIDARFGNSLSISDNWIVVGSVRHARGIAVAFSRPDFEELVLILPDGLSRASQFANDLAIGDVLYVADFTDAEQGVGSGSVLSFDVPSMSLRYKFLMPDGEQQYEFGYSLDLTADYLAIGARRVHGTNRDEGAVFVYKTTNEADVTKIVAPDSVRYAYFGTDVAIDGKLLAVGAPNAKSELWNLGAVYIYDIDTEELLHKIYPEEAESIGRCLDACDDVLVVGAPGDSKNGTRAGSAFVYRMSTGEQLASLTPDEIKPESYFGYSCAISENFIIVAAPSQVVLGDEQCGSIYVYDVNSFECVALLRPSDGKCGDGFGARVAIHESLVVVGAPKSKVSGRRTGAAYVYDLSKLEMQLSEKRNTD